MGTLIYKLTYKIYIFLSTVMSKRIWVPRVRRDNISDDPRSSHLQNNRPGRPSHASSQFAQEEGCTVRITNFPEHMTDDDFFELFNQCGKIKRITVPKYKSTNKAKGFAYIT